MKKRQKLPVTFFKSASGSEPVVDWLRGLGKDDRKQIGLDLLRVQENWPIGMPVCKPLGQGLWEVRSNLHNNRIVRVLFFLDESEICVVHGFIKKSAKAPPQDIELARKRMKEMQP